MKPRQNRVRSRLETLETRELLSAVAELPTTHATVGHPVEVRSIDQNLSIHHAQTDLDHLVTIEAKKPKKVSFSIAQLKSILPGKWRVSYTPSSLFGPGARAVQEITFTGPKGVPQFISTTGVVVQGLVGPAYYQFSSWGTYQFLSKKLVRLTITGASPTEYLNNGIIVPGGESFPVQFQSKNQFLVQGEVYNRIPLNSTVFPN